MMPIQPPSLIQALLQPGCYDHPVRDLRLVETHISWVLLTGAYAYKIKKPVNLGFFDFSSLERRHHYCREELRLNRRLAPQLYLAVVGITGTEQTPQVNGTGMAIEYAVKMREFPQPAQLDHVLARGELTARHIDSLAEEIADFHGRIAVATEDSPFGTPEQIIGPVQENFNQIEARVAASDIPQLERLRNWSAGQYEALKNELAARKRDGFVRECHGDLHLANMMLMDSQVVIFDCLEFNEHLRWIDIMSEIAFLTMDLEDRGCLELARRCLNNYLERTGDYTGLQLLRFYQVYRALVRAKVASIRLDQGGLASDQEQEIRRLYRSYADLAERYTKPRTTPLIITHGFSGSGKTTFTQLLLQAYGGVRIRSDIERKRLHGLDKAARSGSVLASGLYTQAATQNTYQRLQALAQSILRAGFPVIVDAAFLKRAQRDPFRALARQMQVPFIILSMKTSVATMQKRVQQRADRARDASEATVAVLQHQLAGYEPLDPTEQLQTLEIDGKQANKKDDNFSTLLAELKKRT